ncbi:MAG: ferrochelatase [Candidatus Saccharibacteria bacterium]|nr:ferrochelatase [Moraxellaceae bacterium]
MTPILSESFPQPKKAVLLVNLGTPDAPTPQAVGRFLREFLSDQRVIEIPRLLWQVILNLFVIPLRAKRVAHAYADIWVNDDSPMRVILNAQATALAHKLADLGCSDVEVVPVMTYGNPSMTLALNRLNKSGVEQIIVLPLFPQYSATSTGPVYDIVAKWSLVQRNLPSITLIKDYFGHPIFIQALADSVRRYQAIHGQPDKLLMSFHGIPQPYADRGDPYPERCHATARLLAQALDLSDDAWAISFQSRFGRQEWVKPYTNLTLQEWGKSGLKSVQVISPAFSADCLETLEELAVENRDTFVDAGGQHYAYIPALNDDSLHIDMMASLVRHLL